MVPAEANNRPPTRVLVAAGLVALLAICSASIWTISVARLAGLDEVPQFLTHPRFAIPLLLEIAIALGLVLVIIRGWRWARLALLVALALWLPDLLPSRERAASELDYPLGVWFAWFAVLAYAVAASLLYSGASRQWFSTSARQ